MALASATAFPNLRPLILGHHPLDLQQQLVFWTPAQLSLQEDDLDPSPLELIHEQDLVGLLAGQPIRRVHMEALYAPCRDQIPQAFQAGSHQGRPTIALIYQLQLRREGKPVRGAAGAQGGQLAGDGVGFRLLIR